MKESFEKYFEKLNRLYKEEFGTKPSVPYSERWNKDLIVSEPDDEGYVELVHIKKHEDGSFSFRQKLLIGLV